MPEQSDEGMVRVPRLALLAAWSWAQAAMTGLPPGQQPMGEQREALVTSLALIEDALNTKA